MLLLCEKYSPKSNLYKFCPGLDESEYKHFNEVIRFDPKSLRKSIEPLFHVDSVNCRLWFQLSKSSSSKHKEAESVKCPSCVRLKCDLEHQARRTSGESPSKKIKRQEATSHAKLTYMSPDSLAKRKLNQKMLKGNMKRKLNSYEVTEIPLDDEQHEEMESAVATIEENHSSELEKLFLEGDKHGVGSKLRDIWKSDKQREKKEFQEDQLRNSKTEFFATIRCIPYNFRNRKTK